MRAIAVGILSFFAYFSAANDRYDDGAPGPGFNMNIGAFFLNRMETTVRFDSNSVPIGTVIDLENSFQLDSDDAVARIDGYYRFNKEHRLDWTYYASRRDGDAIATREISIGDPDDPDGSDVIPIGAQVLTRWDYDMFKIGYAWSFLNKKRYEWFLGAGLSVRKLDFDIAYSAGAGEAFQEDNFRVKQTVPLPTFQVGGRWGVTPKLDVLFKYELFYIEVGSYRGAQQEMLVLIEHRTFKNVGFGGGFNAVSLDLAADTKSFRGELDTLNAGLMAYVKVFF